MSFINVTVSKSLGNPVFVYGGEDILTFCPLILTLDAVVITGNPIGSTFIWEQVLQYQYLSVNYELRQFTFAGNISTTFYTSREVLELVLESQVAAIFNVTSIVYNGVNTIVTVSDSLLPSLVPRIGVLQHAGSAVDGSFTWVTPPNTLTAIFSPTVFSDKVFRIWSNRGKKTRRYDDVGIILTPRDRMTLARVKINSTTLKTPCLEPVSFIMSNPPSAYGQDGDSSSITPNLWSMHWIPPLCALTGNLIGYIAQTSCNGGDTWTTVYSQAGAQSIPVPTGCAGRVAAVYSVLGTKPVNLQSPELSSNALMVHWSDIVYAGTDTPDTLLSVMSTLSSSSMGPSTYDPISTYIVSLVNLLEISVGTDTLQSTSVALSTFSPIVDYVVTRYILLLLPDAPELTDTLTWGLVRTNISPITSFVVNQIGTIGG